MLRICRSLAANEIDGLHKTLRTEEIWSVVNPTEPHEAAHDKEETEILTRGIADWPHALVAIDERCTNRVELGVLTVVVKGNGDIVSVPAEARNRYRQWRMYPVSFSSTGGNASTGGYLGRIGETAGIPEIYNIEADPREEHNVGAENGWVIVPYLQFIGEYTRSLDRHPNPPAANLTNF